MGIDGEDEACGVDGKVQGQNDEVCGVDVDFAGVEPNLGEVLSNQRVQLMAHQVEAVKWLARLHFNNSNAMLCDDMGLGKTITTLAFCEYLRFSEHVRNSDRDKPNLIIVPNSLVHSWVVEILKYFVDDKKA